MIAPPKEPRRHAAAGTNVIDRPGGESGGGCTSKIRGTTINMSPMTRVLLVLFLIIAGPASAQSNDAVGNCFGGLGQQEAVIADCTRVIESGQLSQPNLANALLRRAGLYRAKGDLTLERNDLDHALRLKPEYAAALYDRGITSYAIGEYDNAILDFDAVIRLRPDFAMSYDSRGKAYAVKGHYDRAIEDFGHAVVLEPGFADGYNNRGTMYFKKGDHDRAIADYNDAIRLEPDHVAAYYNRGAAYEAKGRWDLAAENYRRAQALAPGHPGIEKKIRELELSE